MVRMLTLVRMRRLSSFGIRILRAVFQDFFVIKKVFGKC